jgi:hypothetical protein
MVPHAERGIHKEERTKPLEIRRVRHWPGATGWAVRLRGVVCNYHDDHRDPERVDKD